MSKNIDLTSAEWCDLVFEGKNKAYGAYYLRRTSSRRHFHAIVILVAVAAVLVFLPTLIKQVIPDKKMDAISERVTMVDLGPLDEPEPEQIEQHVPVEVTPPALKEAIAFPPPVVDATATEEDVMRTQEEVTKSKALIFTEDIEGSDSEDAIDPAALLGAVEEVAPPAPPKTNEIVILDHAEESPSYPGGDDAMWADLYSHVIYPPIAIEHGIEGKVLVRFAVMEDGSISRVTVLRSVHTSLDNEAVRAVKSMGKWIPGKQNGRNVAVYHQLVVTFRLEQQ